MTDRASTSTVEAPKRKPRKPTRTDLLAVISSLQGLVGAAYAANHDRNPHRKAQVDGYMQQAIDLCHDARAFDGPDAGKRSAWQRKPEDTGL